MTVDKTFLIRSIQKKKEMIVVFCAYTNMPFVTCDPETFKIILATDEIHYTELTLKELLPLGFGPGNLE